MSSKWNTHCVNIGLKRIMKMYYDDDDDYYDDDHDDKGDDG